MASSSKNKHKWEFKPRFRKGAFGWKSQTPIKRIREAVSEIKKVAKKDKLLAAEGAVIFIEKICPAIDAVDSSSGAIGSTVYKAIESLSPIIANAPCDDATRRQWMDRLWDAYEADKMPYIERLGDHWGELCGSKEIASEWADQLLGPSKQVWRTDRERGEFFNGATNCLSALLKAERYSEILKLLAMSPYSFWPYHKFGAMAFAAQGKKAEAIQYAEECRGRNDNPITIARFCEEMLLSMDLHDEAYKRYALIANEAGTYLAWFRAIKKKYPNKSTEQILSDLVGHTPGEEGKWFAAAKDAKLYDAAIVLANSTPCSPQTLTRAARDFEDDNPQFAAEAGLAAIRWLLAGYGYEITGADVLSAYSHTIAAAKNAGIEEKVLAEIKEMFTTDQKRASFVGKILVPKIGI